MDSTFLVLKTKTIKAIIYKVYNYIQLKIIKQIINETISVSLIINLWTN